MRAISLNLNAIDAVSIVSWPAHALVAVETLVELTVGERMTIIDDIARH